MQVVLEPGRMSLVDWRSIYAGADVILNRDCRAAIDASAATVRNIVTRGEPVYGINTGFGKLASVRIADSDLSALQRNLVMSHSAGVGDATPLHIVRLMMALKLGSLAQGFSGVTYECIEMLEAMINANVTPVVPCQGSVGASGDLARLRI